MTKPKLLCFGHSHLVCIDVAVKWREQSLEGFRDAFDIRFEQLRREPYHPNFVDVGGKRELTTECENAMASAIADFKPDAILAVFSGQEYQIFSILNHPIKFDFVTPNNPAYVPKNSEIIPFVLVKAQLKYLIERSVLIFIDKIKGITNVPVFMVAPPPPIESEEHILTYPGPFAEDAKEFGVSPAPFRRKVWKVYCDILKEEGARHGANVLMPPKTVMDNGYMAQDCWRKDPVHGNVKYGNAIIHMVLNRAFGHAGVNKHD